MTDVIRHAIALLVCVLMAAASAYGAVEAPSFFVPWCVFGALVWCFAASMEYRRTFDALKRLEGEP